MKSTFAAFGLLALQGLAAAVPTGDDSLRHASNKCPLYGSGISARDSFAGYADALYNRRRPSGIRPFWNPTYVLHRPSEPRTAEISAGIQSLEQLDLPTATIGWQLIVPPCGGSDIATTFSRYVPSRGPPLAIVEFYRFEGPCIAEYSMVYEEVPANATNPSPFFLDGPLPRKAVVPECTGP